MGEDTTGTSSTLPIARTVAECADAAGVSEWLVRREIREGRLKAYRIGGRLLRTTDQDFHAWLTGESS